MSRKKKKPRRRQTSSLAEHKRDGRTLKPPMTALMGDKLRPVVWWRDRLPNHLWTCWMVSSGDYRDVARAARILDIVTEAINSVADGSPDQQFAGRLTDLESLSAAAREAVLSALHGKDAYEDAVPEAFAHALGMYPDAPGRWLIEPWLAGGVSIDPVVAQRELGRVVEGAMDGRGDTATRTKALVFRQYLQGGKLVFSREGLPEETRAAIMGYPDRNTDDQNKRAESHFRATYLVLDDASDDWCPRFWRSNWAIFGCNEPAPIESPEVIDADSPQAQAVRQELRANVEDLWNHFVRVAQRVDPDLYEPHRYEVLTGMVGRCLRLLRTVTGYPLMWTMEYGAPVLRAVVEARISLAYLENSGSVDGYRSFKDYGIGRLKLYKLHLEEVLDEADEPPSGLEDYVEVLSAFVNRDSFEEFREVDLGGNAFGIDMRRMAEKTGFARDYRLLFAPASSNVHGEWGAIEMNVMTICGNPLHGNHRILKSRDVTIIGPAFMSDLQGLARDLVNDYERALTGATAEFDGSEE